MNKTCRMCGVQKPLFEFSPDKRNRDGAASRCKSCTAEVARCRRAENPEKAKAAVQKWREANKSKIIEYRRAVYATDPDKYRRKALDHYWANVEHRRKQMAQTARDNRASRRQYEAERRRANPEAARAKVARRRANRLSAPGRGISAADIQEVLNLQRWRCAACGVNIRKGYHIDHIIPLAAGGHHDRSNAQALCPACNTSKGAKAPEEFMQTKGFLC